MTEMGALNEGLKQGGRMFETLPRQKPGAYVGQLSAVAYFYEAWSMALISPSDIRPEVASFILPCGSIKKLEGMAFMALYGLGIIFSATAKTG